MKTMIRLFVTPSVLNNVLSPSPLCKCIIEFPLQYYVKLCFFLFLNSSPILHQTKALKTPETRRYGTATPLSVESVMKYFTISASLSVNKRDSQRQGEHQFKFLSVHLRKKRIASLQKHVFLYLVFLLRSLAKHHQEYLGGWNTRIATIPETKSVFINREYREPFFDYSSLHDLGNQHESVEVVSNGSSCHSFR